jgi:hypothetical protein
LLEELGKKEPPALAAASADGGAVVPALSRADADADTVDTVDVVAEGSGVNEVESRGPT